LYLFFAKRRNGNKKQVLKTGKAKGKGKEENRQPALASRLRRISGHKKKNEKEKGAWLKEVRTKNE
jgi:hypothetical protein